MKDHLVRFGVAMDASLLEAFDAVVASRGSSRSELLRDLTRAEVSRAETHPKSKAFAVATLTLLYDHHVRDLSERLTEIQHELGERVRSTLHIHLDHDNCLEVIVMMGRADQLQEIAGRLFATKGIKHGGIDIIPFRAAPASHKAAL